MAQPGRNGQHEESFNEGSQYVFNPMAFNYHQNQVITPPTVLSQQDATFMADFFNNPDTASTTEPYLAFGFEPRSELVSGAGSPEGAMEGDASLANTTIAHVSAAHGLYANNMLQTTRPAFPSHDFSNIYLSEQTNQHHQQQHHHSQQQAQQPQQGQQQQQHQQSSASGGDAVAGASALIGLSASQEQSNLLNASNYMTWGNIVAAQTVAGPNRHNTYSTAPRAPPVKSNSTSQLQPQLHTPPSHPNSWAEITSQAFMQRARHPSLQLDTAATMLPNHQTAWQNAPQSAFPQANNKRDRPSMVTFGSDERFGRHGFAGSVQHSPEPKFMHMTNIGDIAVTQAGNPASGDLRQVQQSFPQRRSIGAPQQTSHSNQSSPINASGLPTPANSVGAVTSQVQARKRGAAHLDDDLQSGRRRAESGGSPVGRQGNKRRKSTSQHTQVPSGQDLEAGHNADGSTPSTQPRNRRGGGRDQKPPRQNLTDEQKRNNHIASEQKRRDAMKTNFEELNRLVPALSTSGAGLSRSEVLQHTGNALESCKAGNIVMARLLGVDLNILDQESDPGEQTLTGVGKISTG